MIPHDYKRALADVSRGPDESAVSTGGEGFYTTESEDAAASAKVA